jgi:hypothetical protein
MSDGQCSITDCADVGDYCARWWAYDTEGEMTRVTTTRLCSNHAAEVLNALDPTVCRWRIIERWADLPNYTNLMAITEVPRHA